MNSIRWSHPAMEGQSLPGGDRVDATTIVKYCSISLQRRNHYVKFNYFPAQHALQTTVNLSHGARVVYCDAL